VLKAGSLAIIYFNSIIKSYTPSVTTSILK